MKPGPVNADDTDLILAYAAGSKPAFATPVERHGAWVYAAARRRLGRDRLAEDAAQVVFVGLATEAGAWTAVRRGPLAAWLFHVVHFTCARLQRTRQRQAALEQAARTALPRADAAGPAPAELLAMMEDAIARLPAVERDWVVRRFYQDQTFARVGHATGVTAEAARKRVGRALAEVRRTTSVRRRASTSSSGSTAARTA